MLFGAVPAQSRGGALYLKGRGALILLDPTQSRGGCYTKGGVILGILRNAHKREINKTSPGCSNHHVRAFCRT